LLACLLALLLQHACICSLDEQVLRNKLTQLEAGRIKPCQEAAAAAAAANATQEQQKQTNDQIVDPNTTTVVQGRS
jgi:hypothetical protein